MLFQPQLHQTDVQIVDSQIFITLSAPFAKFRSSDCGGKNKLFIQGFGWNYIYIYIYIWMCVCVCVCVYIYICVCVRARAHPHVHVHVCACMRMCVCACVHVSLSHTHTHTHTQKWDVVVLSELMWLAFWRLVSTLMKS